MESADEFYSIMGVLTREMLEFGIMDANDLVKVFFWYLYPLIKSQKMTIFVHDRQSAA